MSTDLLKATCDQFLGGQVKAYQPAKGFRSGSDAVLLAAAVNTMNGEKCLEFGCGVGVASLCLAQRLAEEGVSHAITGIDVQPMLIDLAQKNIDINDMTPEPEFFVQDITTKFSDWVHIQPSSFHHVFANPPYFERDESFASPDESKAQAHVSDQADLDIWVKRAATCLTGSGQFTLIYRADALDRLLSALSPQFGRIVILPISASPDEPASRVIVRATRDAKGKLSLLPPLVTHKDNRYTDEVEHILREGGNLQKRFDFQ